MIGEEFQSFLISDLQEHDWYDDGNKNAKDGGIINTKLLINRELSWWKHKHREKSENILLSHCNGEDLFQNCSRILIAKISAKGWGRGSFSKEENIDHHPVLSPSEFCDICAIGRLVQLACAGKKNLKWKGCKMTTLSLLRCLSGAIDAAIKRRCVGVNNLAKVVIQILLRTINPFVASFAILLPVLWKSICDISSFLHDENELDAITLSDSLEALTFFLLDGEKQSRSMLLTHLTHQLKTEENIVKQNLKTLNNHVKLMIFLVNRLAILLPMLSCYTNASFDSNETLIALSRLCGISTAISTSSHAVEFEVKGINDYLRCFYQLAQRVDYCVMKFVLAESKTVGNTKELSFHDEFLRRNSFQRLIKLTIVRNSFKKSRVDNELVDSVFFLGKLQLLLSILAKIISLSVKTNFASHEWIGNLDFSLAICENILFSVLPMCQAWVVVNVSTDISDVTAEHPSLSIFLLTVNLITDCTLLCEKCSSDDDRTNGETRIQCILVRWLCEDSSEICANTAGAMVPLVMQTIFTIIHMHTVRSIYYNYSSKVNCKTDSDTCFLAFLVEIMFDVRTRTSHRKNIALVLYRLLSTLNNCSNDGNLKILGAVKQIIEKNVIDHLFSLEKKKRRRSDNIPRSIFQTIYWWPSNDVNVILPLIELSSFQEDFWSNICKATNNKIDIFFRNLLQSPFISPDTLSKTHPLPLPVTLTILAGASLTHLHKKSIFVDLKKDKFGQTIIDSLARQCSMISDFTSEDVKNVRFAHALFQWAYLFFRNFQQPCSKVVIQLFNNFLSESYTRMKESNVSTTFVLKLAALLSNSHVLVGVEDSMNTLSVRNKSTYKNCERLKCIISTFLLTIIYFSPKFNRLYLQFLGYYLNHDIGLLWLSLCLTW